MTTPAQVLRAHPMPERSLRAVPVNELFPDPDNPRQDLRDIDELAASMETVGLISPIIARQVDGSINGGAIRLVIVAGHRRHAAAKVLGWQAVDVIVRKDMPADDVLVAMVTENGQRVDLDPIEEARAYYRLKVQMSPLGARAPVSDSAVATRIGRYQAHVSGRLALLTLPIAEQEMIRAKEMNVGDGVRMGRVRSGKIKPSNRTGHPHLGVDHPLHSKARARCNHLGHKKKGRNSVGGVACGACWESVIRANEQERTLAASLTAGRCGICDGPIAPLEAES